LYGGDAKTPEGSEGEVGDWNLTFRTGGDICSDGGRCGNFGAGASSSDSSGVN
jgi:hypothetical protein